MRALWISFVAGPAAAQALLPPSLSSSPSAPARAPVDPFHACLARARGELQRGRAQEALAWLDKAVAHRPDDGFARFSRALCLLQLNRDEEAALELDESERACGPDDVELRFHLARVLVRHGGAHHAMRLLAEAMRQDPTLSERVARDDAFRSLEDHPAYLQMTGRL